jgi:hypothetical protein
MNTETPPPLSNAECLSILTDSNLVAGLAPNQSRALFRAVHALARRTMQKERNARVRAARTFHTPPEDAAAVLTNPPFDPEQKEAANE